MSYETMLFKKIKELLVNDGQGLDEAHYVANQLVDEHIKGSKTVRDASGNDMTISHVCDPPETLPVCTDERYQLSGQCNNKKNPFWGQANIRLVRLRSECGFFSKCFPVGDFVLPGKAIQLSTCSSLCPGRCTPDNTSLPNPRHISSDCFTPDSQDTELKSISNMFTYFGQFLDHDLSFTPEMDVFGMTCCACLQSTILAEPCEMCIFPNPDDTFFSRFGVNCLDFVRSQPWCPRKSTTREQLTTITAYIDASQVYGSDDEMFESLLDDQGLIIMENNLLLKLTSRNLKTGEKRAGETPGLSALHTLFSREHNRIMRLMPNDIQYPSAKAKAKVARLLVIAEMQNIVYNEYLPLALGPELMNKYNLSVAGSSAYDDEVDATPLNEFATAAFRYGHSMVPGTVDMYDPATNAKSRTFTLSETFFNFTEYFNTKPGEGVDAILLGLTQQLSQNNDEKATPELSNLLFKQPKNKFGSDLFSRNIQRGRDHEIRPYFEYYAMFSDDPNKEMPCWEAKPSSWSDEGWAMAQEVYSHPQLIDLFVGATVEKHVDGGQVGVTFGNIIGTQFHTMKAGDRFFFTNPGMFSSTLLSEIRKRTFADVLCENSEITMLQPKAFEAPNQSDNQVRDCMANLNQLDPNVDRDFIIENMNL